MNRLNKNMDRIILIILLVVMLLANYQNSLGYDDEISHPKITEVAVQDSVLRNYLSENLGTEFSKDYDSVIKEKRIIKWIMEGSTAEDAPNCRASNHFHNPLLPWDQSYMTDEPWYIDVACVAWEKYSNVTWATGYLSPPPAGPKASFNMNPYFAPYNWDKNINEEKLL